MKNRPHFFIVDVFANKKYTGNQLAVFFGVDDLPAEEMQQIAREIHFSETTFVLATEPQSGVFPVRIFTPEAEIPFAGHPVLGTAAVIREHLLRKPERQIVLSLKAGLVPVDFLRAGGRGPVLWMEQPAPEFGEILDAGAVADLLGIEEEMVDDGLPVRIVSTGLPHIIVPLRGLAALKNISLNEGLYRRWVAKLPAKAILAFSREPYSDDHDLAVRMFAPHYGIAEDPATGSGNGCLAAYLVRHRLRGRGSINLQVAQGLEIGRPSRLFIEAREEGGRIWVRVGGRVVSVAEGFWGD